MVHDFHLVFFEKTFILDSVCPTQPLFAWWWVLAKWAKAGAFGGQSFGRVAPKGCLGEGGLWSWRVVLASMGGLCVLTSSVLLKLDVIWMLFGIGISIFRNIGITVYIFHMYYTCILYIVYILCVSLYIQNL